MYIKSIWTRIKIKGNDNLYVAHNDMVTDGSGSLFTSYAKWLAVQS